jgi:rare lipoprotein A
MVNLTNFFRVTVLISLSFTVKISTMNRILLFLFFPLCAFVISEYSEEGTASYYGNSFNGRRTASGDIFRQDSLTAAHKTLKFGTIVKVVNLKNDSIVIVRINDRLPRSSSRIIDLSLRAAKQLNFVRAGLAKVQLTSINVTDTLNNGKK